MYSFNNILGKGSLLSIQPSIEFEKIVEIPVNQRNSKIIELLVGEKKDLKRKQSLN